MPPLEPRATNWMHGDGAFGPHNRLRCACCGCPTLDGGFAELEGPSWPKVCLLCDWENPDPGEPTSAGAASNDDVTLPDARRNVQRFHWMYDPGNLPAWLAQAPSRAELQARAELHSAYDDIDADPEELQSAELWEVALDYENTLRAIVDARVADSADVGEDDEDLEEYTP